MEMKNGIFFFLLINEYYIKKKIIFRYCSACKKHVRATKKIDLWKLPSVLLISFKRFKYTTKEKKKIDTRVDFKVQFFDLSKFVPEKLQKSSPEYMMFAACVNIFYISFCER